MSTSARRVTAIPSKTYHHGNLRNALLASARVLVVEGGIDGFHLREVARRAGVSHTAAYNHFADKAALVGALVSEAFATLAAELRAAAESCEDPLERLERIGCAYVVFAYTHPAEFRFMWRPELCSPSAARDDAEARDPGARGAESRDAGTPAYQVLVDAIGAALDSGTLSGNRETLVLTAWSTVHGLAALLIDGPRRAEALTRDGVETSARGVTRTLIAGMLARSAAAS